MEVEAAGGLEDAAQFHKAGRHHHQIGHHGVLPDEPAEGLDHLLDRRGCRRVQDNVLLVGAFRLQGPLPGIGECLDLGGRLLPRLLAEQHVVGGVGVERRVQVNQVHRLIGYMIAEHLQVVAVE